jgi:inosine/xanthosine triphosphatase
MKVVIASKNPVKIEAAKLAFGMLFGDKAATYSYEGMSVESNVSEQPMDAHETAKGAVNRAYNLQKLVSDADYLVGIEGGLSTVLIHDQDYTFEQTWACVIECKRSLSELGSGPAYPLPPKVVELIEAEHTLTDAMAEVYGTVDLGRNEGYNGWLSNNRIDRTEASKMAVFLALCAIDKTNGQSDE